MNQPMSDVASFFKNRSVFITGVTGFLGKATLEKLLRTCSEITTVYVLIRPKRNVDVEARLKELLDNPLYEILKKSDPNALKKISPINGDISFPSLGISKEDEKILINHVSVIIHSAATVKFDEKLKISMNINVQGTKRIVELSKQMKKLEALIYVSTAYANCDRSEIDEVVYAPPADPNKLIEWLEKADDDEIEQITPKLIGNKPNTYTFTKSLAEHILVEEAQNLPVCIVRPSIVTAAWKEPVPGWIDNLNGPTGLMIAVGKGLLRTSICHRNKVVDFIPLDFSVNLIISAAWYTAQKNNSDEIKVFNCCSGTNNPLLWGQFMDYLLSQLVSNPLSNAYWYPLFFSAPNKTLSNIIGFFIHFIPACMMDTLATLTGRKPLGLNIHKKIEKAVNALEYFSANEWRFKTDNTGALYQELSPKDKQLFNLNVSEVQWSTYVEKYCIGVRQYVLKDDDSTLPAARNRIQKLYWMHNSTKLFLTLVGCSAFMLPYKYK